MRKMIQATVLAAFTAPPVWACPVCDSTAGRQVQAGLFGHDFLPTAVAVLLPIAVMAGIVALIHYAFPNPRGG